MTQCGWKVSDGAVNIEKCAMKIKAIDKNDKAVVVLNNHRFVLLLDVWLRFLVKRVRADSNIKRLSRPVGVLVRTGEGLNNFDSCPASHDIFNPSVVERHPVQQALIFFARLRSIRRCLRMY
jgi:hypothetical protein